MQKHDSCSQGICARYWQVTCLRCHVACCDYGSLPVFRVFVILLQILPAKFQELWQHTNTFIGLLALSKLLQASTNKHPMQHS